ncbi:hypothetical protein [Neptuniibacter sp. QD37_11]|uniref:hypothetical protein n=1 Tax=Neptuniibacter sp. QD37_11 TaxID=3398209 RepID=UPI0039F532F2
MLIYLLGKKELFSLGYISAALPEGITVLYANNPSFILGSKAAKISALSSPAEILLPKIESALRQLEKHRSGLPFYLPQQSEVSMKLSQMLRESARA